MIIKSAIIKKVEKNAKKAILDDLEKYLAPSLDAAGINTPNRVAHFLAQAAHESDGFKTLQEYWGPTAAQKRYEGRTDLGNTVAGDGSLFRGRGIFQLTGRANYTSIGKAIKVDLVTDPTVAATGKVSVQTAIYYWNSRKLNELADKDDVRAITKKINGGYNGLDDRIARLAKFRTVIDEIFAEATPDHPEPIVDPIQAPTPDTTPFLVFAKLGMSNEMVKIIQVALNHKGYSLSIDGNFGPLTEAAVKDFQKKNKLDVDGLVGPITYAAILKV